MSDNGKTTLEYIGKGDGAQWFKTADGTQIRAGRGPAVRYVQVSDAHAEELVATKKFQRVPPPATFVTPPDPGTVRGGTLAESATFAEPPPDGKASPFPGTKARKHGKASPFPGTKARKHGKASPFPGTKARKP